MFVVMAPKHGRVTVADLGALLDQDAGRQLLWTLGPMSKAEGEVWCWHPSESQHQQDMLSWGPVAAERRSHL